MGIVFTRAWEDDRLDLELLAIGPGERALVVGGAGDAALALAEGGGEVVAVDRNPDQLRLGALKLAAARVLPPERLHAWFEGAGDAGARGEYRDVVRGRLSPDDAAFWDPRIGFVERGLHRSVGLGRPFITLGRIARILRRDLPRRVESFADPAEQQAWWRRNLRPWLFGPVGMWLMARGSIIGKLSPNRNETARVRRAAWPRGFSVRVDDVLGRLLVREHPWWRPLASGRPAGLGHGAAWLDPDRVIGLAAAGGDRLRWVHADLTEALEAQLPSSLDALSVSNVPDWLDEGAEVALARAAARALAPGGRLLVRHIVRPAGPNPYLAAGLTRAPESDGLAARDRTAMYETIDLYRAP